MDEQYMADDTVFVFDGFQRVIRVARLFMDICCWEIYIVASITYSHKYEQ